jgi:lipopolysaccharide transport system ATP-binding protein
VAEPVIVFDRVSKKFRRGERHDSLRDLIPATAKALFRRRRSDELEDQEFWAVRDVSFEVKRGEALGIIGPNGAGKSTSLKLLTKILKPTAGHCHITGRSGALIEVAAGFHPDLTGRENIFLQGAIMGMRRQEIGRRFDEIVEFAGVADFIDTPVKRYSSGMNARLGFSIAAHLSPDALVIDEVLSVGDAAFQEKCVQRMTEFKRQGIAIAFVSHNLQAVSQLCDMALYLKRQTQAIGTPEDVIGRYLANQDAASVQDGNGAVTVVSAELVDGAGRPVGSLKPGERATLRTTWRANAPVSDYHVSFLAFRSTDGLPVYDGLTSCETLNVLSLAPHETLRVDFEFVAHLTRGHYFLASHMYHNPTQECLARIKPAAMFFVEERRTYAGVADLEVAARAVTPAEGDS